MKSKLLINRFWFDSTRGYRSKAIKIDFKIIGFYFSVEI